MATNPEKTSAQIIDRYASQCVKCALCLPHCPTYGLTGDENESPRGRIALFQALAQEKLPLTRPVKKHLDQCLGCRACEPICPAHVEYGQLLVQGRAFLKTLPTAKTLPPESFITRLIQWLVQKPHLQRKLHWLLWGSQISGLRRLAQIIKLPSLFGLQRLDEILPPVKKPFTFLPTYPAYGLQRGTVMLFTGCISSWCDQETLMASLFMLRQLGFKVLIPSKQTCCGAIALHAGDLSQSQHLAHQNYQAMMAQEKIDHVVTTATGCSAVLQSYDYHLSSQSNSNKPAFEAFSSKVIDIISFIHQQSWPAHLIPQPLPLKILLHTPCTRRFVLKSTHTPEQLLARIPQLTWQIFKNTGCCGAAGTYLLNHPEMSAQLAQKLLSELDNIQVDCLATTNIGCALHLLTQLKKDHISITVSHPVTLLARSLGFNASLDEATI